MDISAVNDTPLRLFYKLCLAVPSYQVSLTSGWLTWQIVSQNEQLPPKKNATSKTHLAPAFSTRSFCTYASSLIINFLLLCSY